MSKRQLVGSDDDELMYQIIASDSVSQKYVLQVMQHYIKSLCLDSKHVYQALPRLLSLWFEFTSIENDTLSEEEKGKSFSLFECVVVLAHDLSVKLEKSKEDANILMGKNFRSIPAQAFYTAFPQLISRIAHQNKDTTSVVTGILKRVLTKFPAQSLWPLAWLLHSKAADRKKAGEMIFKEAQKNLSNASNPTHFQMLRSAKSLFKFFHELARYNVKDQSTQTVNIKSWRGEVALCEFLPPIQAALAISSDTTEGGYARDPFPRQVPRMRCFSQRVTIMSSKAKPKKIKAYVVTADSRLSTKEIDSAKGALKNDIGEVHFLVKQEAKGDLRKDARVQDLNNVINRLVSAAGKSQGASAGKRLNLRTFVVTCLSEDTVSSER